MKFIIDFYQSLDALNVIIFWGIIIVILLLIVFVILMISKNKKNKSEKKHKNYNDELYSDEIALPSNSRDTLIMKDDNLLIQEEKQNTFEPFVIPEKEPIVHEKVEVEKKFHAEEHVMKYDNEMFNLSHVKNNTELSKEEQQDEPPSEKTTFQMPTKPYERNVLREMSLGQTSPIGIVKNDRPYTKPIHKQPEILENKPNDFNHNPIQENVETPVTNQKLKETTSHKPTIEISTTIHQEEPIKIETTTSPINHNYSNDYHEEQSSNPLIADEFEDILSTEEEIDEPLLKSSSIKNIEENNEEDKTKVNSQSNATFLEEVSQKLAEADIPDEIDRTDYELQQEEDAIISYKELMAKKDTIKTVDEEDAIISIQELTARKNNQEKLYNLTEEEENNEFLDELKKFRNDLN